MLHEFKLGHNAIKATKKVCYTKDKGAVIHSTVTRWFKKFCSICKNLNNQASSGKPKAVDSKVECQVIEANLGSNTWRVSGELGILQFSDSNNAKLLTHTRIFIYIQQFHIIRLTETLLTTLLLLLRNNSIVIIISFHPSLYILSSIDMYFSWDIINWYG